ncbi:MAG TPA: GNAT family N-acetyltransferase [Thermoplasmata archaeon]|nr:GNAT family N-acetyltransferase [Thermoplasmata archaeon]
MEDVEIVPFDPKTVSRDEWRRFHASRRTRHAEETPDDPLTGDGKAEALMKRDNPEAEEFRWMAVDRASGAFVGELYFSVFKKTSPTYATNGHIAWLDVAVLAPYRRRGIGTRLFRMVPELAARHGIRSFAGWVTLEDGKAFLPVIGAPVGSRRRENRLSLDRVDWPMVEGWRREGPSRSPGTSLRWLDGRIDEDILDRYADLYTETGNQQPRDGLDIGDFIRDRAWFEDRAEKFAAIGETWWSLAAVERDGAVSGLTEMIYEPEETDRIYQGLTGVREAYRGRGLGKWVKAEMLLRVRRELPQVRIVSTWNATTNAAMLAINDALGFRENRVSEMPQMSVEALEAWLARGKTRA